MARSWHDAPMNVVELSNASRLESSESSRRGNRFTWRLTGPYATRISVAFYAAGLILVAAAQWFPMVGTGTVARTGPVADGAFALTANIATAPSILQIPYYLIWVVVFVLTGTLVFSSRATRPMLFGASVGALGVQALVVLPVLRRPALILSVSSELSSQVSLHRMSGMYYLVAAFVALAVSIVFAVRGQVLPVADGLPSAPQPPVESPVDSVVPRASMHDALAESLPGAEEQADIDFGWPRGTVASSEGTPEKPVDHAIPQDHEIYRRPTADQFGRAS
jgi:hypothetical protein